MYRFDGIIYIELFILTLHELMQTFTLQSAHFEYLNIDLANGSILWHLIQNVSIAFIFSHYFVEFMHCIAQPINESYLCLRKYSFFSQPMDLFNFPFTLIEVFISIENNLEMGISNWVWKECSDLLKSLNNFWLVNFRAEKWFWLREKKVMTWWRIIEFDTNVRLTSHTKKLIGIVLQRSCCCIASVKNQLWSKLLIDLLDFLRKTSSK